MKKLFLSILIFSLSENVLAARTFYLNVMTMASSMYDTGAIEASLFFWNPSSTDQTINLSNISLSAFGINSSGSVNCATENRAILAPAINGQNPGLSPFNQLAIRLNGSPSAGNFIDLSNPITIPKQTHLQVVIDLRPNIAFLGNSAISTNGNIVNTVSGNNNGPFFGYVVLSGSIVITDNQTGRSGFITGSGSILRPVIEKGMNSAQSYEFTINNRNPM